MAIDSTHPLYEKMRKAWEINKHSEGGELDIKAEGNKYLPYTSSQIAKGAGKSPSVGQAAYDAYRTRAVYPDIFPEAIENALGTLHREQAQILLPKSMEFLRNNATAAGESLLMVLRRVNRLQLLSRAGVLGDVKRLAPRDLTYVPKLSIYEGLDILNWNHFPPDKDSVSRLAVAVLDESGDVIDEELEWNFENRYRVIKLDEAGRYATAELRRGESVNNADYRNPQRQGSYLNEIPFEFINARDLSPDPEYPPFLGLALACLVIYRGEADYRQALFMQTQETMVRYGVTGPEKKEDVVIGAETVMNMTNEKGKVEYVGVSGRGLGEQRQSLENDYTRAAQRGGQLIDTTSAARESGDALRIRDSARTMSYPNIAQTGATGLENVIKAMCPWFDADPDDVKVIPNLDFTPTDPEPKKLVELATAMRAGMPLSIKSAHKYLQREGYTTKSFDDEMEEIANQEPDIAKSLLLTNEALEENNREVENDNADSE